jgi:hypothetical protein
MNEYEMGLRYDEIFDEVLKSMRGAGGAVCRRPEKETAIKLAKEAASLSVKLEKLSISEWLEGEGFDGLADRI